MRQEISSFPGRWLLWWRNQYWGSFWSYGNRARVGSRFSSILILFSVTYKRLMSFNFYSKMTISENDIKFFDPWKFLGRKERFFLENFIEISKRTKKTDNMGEGGGCQKVGPRLLWMAPKGGIEKMIWKNMSTIKSRTVV